VTTALFFEYFLKEAFYIDYLAVLSKAIL